MKSKKELIINHSAKLFRKNGFVGTSMQDIAQSLGIKAASLYNHISSKNEILEIILMNVANDFITEMEMIKSSSIHSLKKIEKLINLHVRLTVESTDHMAMLIGDWTHLDPKKKKQYLKLRDQYELDFKQIIQDCIDEGHFNPVNIEVALFSILSTLRWTYSWYSKNKNISPIDLEYHLYQTLIKGLEKN